MHDRFLKRCPARRRERGRRRFRRQLQSDAVSGCRRGQKAERWRIRVLGGEEAARLKRRRHALWILGGVEGGRQAGSGNRSRHGRRLLGKDDRQRIAASVALGLAGRGGHSFR